MFPSCFSSVPRPDDFGKSRNPLERAISKEEKSKLLKTNK